MRTTINIDDDLAEAARAIARLEQRSLGSVISSLARRGLSPPARIAQASPFPVFEVPFGTAPITDETVAKALEEV